jgi:signal transduction histidine kinase
MDTLPKVFSPAEAAAHLRLHKARILKTWETKACLALEAARKLCHPVLLDHIPIFLDNLADAVECDGAPSKKKNNAEIGTLHGEQRASTGDYSFDQVIAEYRLLRVCILEAMESECLVTLKTQMIINSYLDEGITNATVEFLRIHQNNITAMYEHNIAEQRKAKDLLAQEHALLQEERSWLHAVFANAPAELATLRGPELIFEMANPAFRKSVGAGRIIEGRKLSEAFPEMEPSLLAAYNKIYETGERAVLVDFPVTLDWENTGHPSLKYFTYVWEPLKNSAGETYGLMTFGYEVTEQVLYRRKMKADKDALEIEKDLREQFVNTLTHDLRSPLTAGKMSAQVIQRRPTESEFVLKQAARIVQNFNRADQMIQDLLDANQIHAGKKIPLEMHETNLNEVLAHALVDLTVMHGDLFTVQAQAKTIGFWNANALTRVIENLVNNAVKYGTPHSPVTISLKHHSENAILSVHNVGNPIPQADQDNIFEAFKRTGTAEKSGHRGWGLGLTLVSGTAVAHGGTIQVVSSALEGTTFTLTLPLDSRPFVPVE